MDQIASIEKLQLTLNRLNITEDYSLLQDLITELHFVYQSFVFLQRIPEFSDQRTLWDVAYYLLTSLTNPVRILNLPLSHIKDGLAISGLVFELLGLWAETREDQEMRKTCFLNAAISNTLSNYEANSTVLANHFFDSKLLPNAQEIPFIELSNLGMNLVFALLGRNFLWLQKNQNLVLSSLENPDVIMETLADDRSIHYAGQGFWQITILAILRFSEFMFGGEEENFQTGMMLQSQARNIARDYELLMEHWLASKLLNCYRVMAERSTWRILRNHGFSDNYISTLTRIPWNSVHEIWNSQLTALTALENPGNETQQNILSEEVRRAVISMPTSAGKTLVAELLIAKELENHPGSKCVYVAPSRSLVDEVEIKLHKRLRFLGYRVASVIGGFELSGMEKDLLDTLDVAVLTPEKLDYLIRKRDPFISNVSLIIFDEMHKVSEGNRGWFLETLISWIMLKPALADIKLIFMSAVLPNTQQPLVRLWLGEEGRLAPIASNDWMPTRKLIGVFSYQDIRPDWRNPIEIRKNGNRVYWGKSARLTFHYDIGTQFRTLEDIYRLKFWIGPGEDYNRKGDENETRYQRCYKVINLLGIQNSTLVYFQTKLDLVRFCNQAPSNLPRINPYLSLSQEIGLEKLQDYITRRLGEASPLLVSLPFGVAFHHGDLPLDVRSEIEAAYRQKIIRVLACTTTLAEGINLPIQNLVIGYPQTQPDGGHRLSVRDFKNIVGRAGRALIETEGKIIAIRHPEFGAYSENNYEYFNQLIRMDADQMIVNSQIANLQQEFDIVDELNALTQAINDLQSLAQLEYGEVLAEEVQRLQVFIFSLFEDAILDTTPESIRNALQKTLLFSRQYENQILESIERLSQKFVATCNQIDNSLLRTYNKTGLRYSSNIRIEQLASVIANRWVNSNDIEIEFVNIILPEDQRFILENIYEAQPKESEYSAAIFPLIEGLDHYQLLIAWLTGLTFASIRDEFFVGIADTSIRTEVCQSYISKQFSYKLPWVFSAIHAHLEKYELNTLSAWIETLPAQVKYGVNTPEAVYFCTAGIRSRFLAIHLANLYRSQNLSNETTDWKSLEDWFVNLDPYQLRDNAQQIPELAIRQAIRRVNTIRFPNRILQREGFILFYLAGWQYYRGEQFLSEIIEALDSETALVRFAHEPDNEYDEYAVSVHWGDQINEETKIGYVPRAYNEEITEFILLGRSFSARINLIDPIRPNRWRPVRVLVTME